MAKKIAQIIRDEIAGGDQSTTDGLRSLAGMPVRNAQVTHQVLRSRIVEIHRDAFGNVIGSTERIEETEHTDTFGSWTR